MRAPLATGLALAAAVAAHAGARAMGRTWGASAEEAAMPLPGDDLVSDASSQSTMAVSIDAPPEAVWPWLVQMGVDRAGLYSHTWVENGLLRLGVRNADAIHPEWQDLHVGDHIWFVPQGYRAPRFGPRVVEIAPNRHLVCILGEEPGTSFGTWQFVLNPQGASTRLLFRERGGRNRPLAQRIVDLVAGPGYVYMNIGMLAGITARAERAAEPAPLAEPPLRAASGQALRALVAVASAQGSTRQVARAIAATLRGRGIDAEIAEAADVTDVGAYDAVVIGSALHTHHWLPAARELALTQGAALRGRPVWLFTSGMLAIDTGEPWPEPYPRERDELLAATGAREHRIFAGRRAIGEPKAIWSLLLSRPVWAVFSRMVHAPRDYRPALGDYRDWEGIERWAIAIADDLRRTERRAA